MNWQKQIEARLAICQDDELAWSIVQALLDVAVAADRQETLLRPLDITIRDALDKLREVGDE